MRVEHVHVNEGGQAIIGAVAVKSDSGAKAYAARLKSKHGRKSGFWSLIS